MLNQCFACFSQQQPKSPQKSIENRLHPSSPYEQGHLSPPVEHSPNDPPSKPNSMDSIDKKNSNESTKSARIRTGGVSGSSTSLPHESRNRHFAEVDDMDFACDQVVPKSQQTKKRLGTQPRSTRSHSAKSRRSKTPPRYRRSDMDLERELEHEFNLRPSKSEMSPDKTFGHSRQYPSNARSVTLNTLHPGLRSHRKQDWYHGFAPLPRKESFAFKNPNWYGGAGSVRNLVRHYEFDIRRRRVSRDEFQKENHEPPPPVKPKPVRSSGSKVQEQATAPPMTSNTDSGSSGKRRQQKNSVPFAFDTVEGAYPLLPPPANFAAPSAPPLTADVFDLPPPPPSPPSSFQSKQKYLPFPPPPPPELLRPALKRSTSESDKNDDSSPMPNSDSLSSPLTQRQFPNDVFHEVHETYFTATGEGTAHIGNMLDRSENSEKSRMGDFRSVERAVGSMASRLKHPKLPRSGTRDRNPLKNVTSRHLNAPLDAESTTDRYEMRDETLDKSENRRMFVTQESHELVLENEENETDVYNNQLSKILHSGGGEKNVTYSRFPDPFPLYSGPPRKTGLSKKHELHQSNSEGNSVVRVFAGRADRNTKMVERSSQRAISGKGLCFDAESMERTPGGNYIKKEGRKSTHIVRRLRGDVFENKRGEVIFTIDARTGYEFSSTIALRTSDLSKYSVTQTQRELRTGRAITKRWEVFGSGVTQKVVVDHAALAREQLMLDRTRSLDDTIPSLNYEFPSDASDGL